MSDFGELSQSLITPYLYSSLCMNRNVAIDDLEVGMYISDAGNEWIPAKRTKRKGYIRSQATIDKIKSLGVLHVCIEFPDTGSANTRVDKTADSIDPDAKNYQSIAEEIQKNERIVMMDSKHADNEHVRTESKKTSNKVLNKNSNQGISKPATEKKSSPKKTATIKERPERIVMKDSGNADKEKTKREKEPQEKSTGKQISDSQKNEELDVEKSTLIKSSEAPSESVNEESKINNMVETPSKGGLVDQFKAKKDNKTSSVIPLVTQEGIAQKAKKYIPGAVVVPFEVEIINAKNLHCNAKKKVEEAMSLAKMGKPFDIDGIEEMADGLIESIISNRNTLSMVTVLKSQDNYLYEHSVNCGVLMGIFARHLKLAFEVIHDLVVGAILHDIGMTEVPEEIINNPGPLTEPQKKEMQRHVIAGRKILEKNRGIPAIALEVCKQHHERLDGTGYMLKIHSHQVNQYGRVGAIVDVYDALTSDRSYRKAFSPSGAMKKLLEMAGGELDSKLVYQFIQCINIFPVGSLVQLDDSRVGVVYELNIFKKDKPKIKVFYSGKDEAYFKAETVDLADPNVRIKIKKTVEIDDFDIELDDVI